MRVKKAGPENGVGSIYGGGGLIYAVPTTRIQLRVMQLSLACRITVRTKRLRSGTTQKTIHSVIGGLGGRTITLHSLRKILDCAIKGDLEQEVFMDLEGATVLRELKRQKDAQSSGPAAENILRDMGVVSASKTH